MFRVTWLRWLMRLEGANDEENHECVAAGVDHPESDREQLTQLSKRVRPWGKRIGPRTKGTFIAVPCIPVFPELEMGRPKVALVEASIPKARIEKAIIMEPTIPEVGPPESMIP